MRAHAASNAHRASFAQTAARRAWGACLPADKYAPVAMLRTFCYANLGRLLGNCLQMARAPLFVGRGGRKGAGNGPRRAGGPAALPATSRRPPRPLAAGGRAASAPGGPARAPTRPRPRPRAPHRAAAGPVAAAARGLGRALPRAGRHGGDAVLCGAAAGGPRPAFDAMRRAFSAEALALAPPRGPPAALGARARGLGRGRGRVGGEGTAAARALGS
jgi:hypothetical protein